MKGEKNMATYRNLTPKQLELLEPMAKEAAVLKKKCDEIAEKISQKVIIDFEENKRLRKMERDFKKKYKEKQAEINDIVNAREEYEYCLKKANSLCQRADSLKKTWGFE